VDTTPPTVPQGLDGAATGASRIDLTWSPSSDPGGTGVSGYRLYRDGALLASPTGTGYADLAVGPGTTYVYEVSAVDAASPANESARSSPRTVRTPAVADTTPPSVPQGFAAVATGSGRVDLSWSASSDAGGSGVSRYRVYRDGAALAEPTSTAYVDLAVAQGTTYVYEVSALDAATPANESARSASRTVTTPIANDTTAPTVPADLTATAVGTSEIRLTWSPSADTGGAGFAGYRVYRDGGTTPLASVPVNAYADTGLSPGTTYRYTVTAYDAATPANESAPSAASQATTATLPPPVSGLDARPSNPTCVAPVRPTPGGTVTTQRVFPGLTFSSPVALLQAPADASRWFVVEQGGTVRAFANQPSVATSSVFVTVPNVSSGGEMGLLGMAFHPGFPANPRVYLSYTTSVGGALRSRISEFTTPDGGLTLAAGSERVLLTVNQPYSNHNGGHIAFGPDGYLYAGFGDGGSGGDPQNNAQTLTTLLGKILRIDVDAGSPYGVPAGNPFAANPLCNANGTGAQGCPEIFAWGFRNPWRWSFDRQTGQLWAGDVGQGAWEEIDVVVLGGNYGWRFREGAHCYSPFSGCPTAGLVEPVSEYDHSLGSSVTGGYVYRGSAVASLAGRYVFGDFASGRIWIADPQGSRTPIQIADTNHAISSFGEGLDGELYVVDYAGTLHAIQPGTAGGGSIPASLADTGCADPVDPTRPAPGLIPYAPNAALWSDGASKERWIALPDGLDVDVSSPDGDWDLPNGTVLVKSFRLGTQLVETRLLMRHPDGVWAGYTYEWNDAQTAATLVQGGKSRQVSGQSWIYPSEAQCLVCHTAGAGRSLSLETAQLNGSLLYPQTGRTANQIATLNAIGTLAPLVAADPATLPAYPDPHGTAGSLADRARAYLHSNCSNCHRPGGSTPVPMDLRFSTPLAGTGACNAVPQAGDVGLGSGARLVVPGNPDLSVMVARMGRRDAAGMPPLGSNVVDAAGVALVRQWIASLAGCD
jgi:uncharacterized repeat protein (TIGR03806 family)